MVAFVGGQPAEPAFKPAAGAFLALEISRTFVSH
jgi:hypothetical protein